MCASFTAIDASARDADADIVVVVVVVTHRRGVQTTTTSAGECARWASFEDECLGHDSTSRGLHARARDVDATRAREASAREDAREDGLARGGGASRARATRVKTRAIHPRVVV